MLMSYIQLFPNKMKNKSLISRSVERVRDAVAQWLAHRTPNRVVRVRSLAIALCCVLGQDTLLSQCLYPPRSINKYRQTLRET